MHRIRRRAEATAQPQRTLTLPFDRRQKSRLRARLDAIAGEVQGPEVAIELERGTSLGDGDLLEAEDGSIVLVRAQPESVSVARSSNALSLARAAYHLGNRHVPIQILVDEIRYQHDHVLDDMVSHLGVALDHSVLPFQPEFGAYGSGHSHLSHGHGHSRGHGAHIHLHGHSHHHEHDGHGPHSHEGADQDSHADEDAHDPHVHEDGNDDNAHHRHDDQGGTSQRGDHEARSSRSRP